MAVTEVKCTKCGYEFFARKNKYSSIDKDEKTHVEIMCANKICSNNDCIEIRLNVSVL